MLASLRPAVMSSRLTTPLAFVAPLITKILKTIFSNQIKSSQVNSRHAQCAHPTLFLCACELVEAAPRMVECMTKNPRTGVVEVDPDRTSTNANVARAEAPSIVEKLIALGACDERQLETLQVLRYTEGQVC